MDQRTVGYCANQESGKIFLLRKVQPGWDLWSVGTIGPGCFGRVRHDSDVCVARGIAMKGEWAEEGKRGSGANEKGLEVRWKEVKGVGGL